MHHPRICIATSKSDGLFNPVDCSGSTEAEINISCDLRGCFTIEPFHSSLLPLTLRLKEQQNSPSTAIPKADECVRMQMEEENRE